MINIDELECDIKSLPSCSWSASAVLELITRLEAAQNSDQHNFDRWQKCQEMLEAAEKDAAKWQEAADSLMVASELLMCKPVRNAMTEAQRQIHDRIFASYAAMKESEK